MKRYIKIIGVIEIVFACFSCDKYLETESMSTFTEESIFTNLDFATKAVNGIYLNLTNYYLYDNSLIYYQCDNDIEFGINADDGSYRSLGHYSGDEGNARILNEWNVFYQTIERANICIDNLPKSPIWEGEYAEMAKCLYGEAVTMRAWLYFELIRIWGDVPFTVKSTQSGDNFNLPKTDRDSIYEYLIQDLADIEEYVPWATKTKTTERVNKGFVKGLRAKMALTYAGYSLRNKTFETRRGRYWEDYLKIANQECREIMESGNHQLNPSFENIFKTLHSYQMDLTYNEVLFEVAFGRGYSGRWGYSIGMPFYATDPKYGKSGVQIYTSPYYYYSFDRKDSRRNVSVELYDYNNSAYLSKQSLVSSRGLSFSICKYRKSWISPAMGGAEKSVTNTGINCPLMRYTDVVLMFAETENEINGPTQPAKNALSLVRQRAFPSELWDTKVLNYVDSVSVSNEDFFNAIVDERSWEFGGEMIRKYDLVRWNLLGAKINEMKEVSRKIINNDPEYANVPTYIFWKYKNDGETLDILNPDYRLQETTVAGYTATAWLPLMTSVRKVTFNQSYDLIAHGYNESKNNHLFPIHGLIITSSNGVLSNDQIP